MAYIAADIYCWGADNISAADNGATVDKLYDKYLKCSLLCLWLLGRLAEIFIGMATAEASEQDDCID